MIQKSIHFASAAYRHSLFRYIIIGGSTFVIDLLILIGLKEIFAVPVLIAATVSYWLSLAYNFILNRTWSFGASEGKMRRHVLFYSVMIVVNYFFGLLLIALLHPIGVSYAIAKMIAVTISTTWNYLGYRHFVFRH